MGGTVLVELSLEFVPAGFDEDVTVGENDGRHALIAVVDLHDEFSGFMVAFESDAQVGDVVRFEELLCADAIGAIFRRVHDDLGWVECVFVVHGCLVWGVYVFEIFQPRNLTLKHKNDRHLSKVTVVLTSFRGAFEDPESRCEDAGDRAGIGRRLAARFIENTEQRPSHAAGAMRPDRIGGDALEAIGYHAEELQVGLWVLHKDSAPGAGRTRNHQIRSLLLCPLSYGGDLCIAGNTSRSG